MWDARTGKPLGHPLTHSKSVRSARFSPDGTKVLTASEDGTACVWDGMTASPISAPVKADWWLTFADFSGDGSRFVTAGHGTVKLWDIRGNALPGLQDNLDCWNVETARLSPAGDKIAALENPGQCRVWDLATRRALTPPSSPRFRWIHSLTFSNDGEMLAMTAGDYGPTRVWDASTGVSLTSILEHPQGARQARFSPGGNRLVTSGVDGKARIWDLTPDLRPLVDLQKLGELLACQRIDEIDGLRLLTVAEETARWEELRSKYPEQFQPPTLPGSSSATHPAQ